MKDKIKVIGRISSICGVFLLMTSILWMIDYTVGDLTWRMMAHDAAVVLMGFAIGMLLANILHLIRILIRRKE